MQLAHGQVQASGAAPAANAGEPGLSEQSIAQWLQRVHAAPRKHNYVGTIVVSSQAGAMASARIWHACTADQQVERVDSLSGPPRSSVRHEDRVVTLLPEQKLARIEQHESLRRFPDLLASGAAAITDNYTARQVGTDRIAGFDAEVVHLAPRDALRFGYRVWTERKSGLVVKLQTLSAEGAVLEQTAFSELQLDVPIRVDRLLKLMTPPPGWRIERHDATKTTAAAAGWQVRNVAPGFKPMDCYRRNGGAAGALQCVFSDGIAAVSLFVEPGAAQSPVQEGTLSAGATHTVSRRLQDWRITAVGEVPPQVLRGFVQGLERLP
ncbi:MucB/RseB C-terminal domain-containing protein [Ramlibacter sp. AN1015]|uniref:MucB/RseB C-terminal domain-containing protein n=1 Tax=Ramlibacter sp. AN1015 TaxID=3133428 RepID=UPI0030C13EAE